MIKRTGYFIIPVLLVISFVVNSCETDVDLTAPYKSVPVIIGLLDHTADTQFFRINRTFLAEGNANTFAAYRDSVEYPDGSVTVWLVKYQAPSAASTDINQWTKLDSIQLQAIDIPSRQPGVFYNTNVRFYYTTQPILTTSQIANIANMRYQMKATLAGKQYEAVTNFPTINQGNITFPVQPAPGFPQQRLDHYSNVQNTFLPVNFAFTVNSGTTRYEGTYRLNYDVFLNDGNTLNNQFIDYFLGTTVFEPSSGTSTASRNFNLNGESWYQFIGERFGAIPNVKKIRIKNVEFRLTGGNTDLNNYISVAQPISQFVPVLSVFTNLSGDAIGIFAAKTELIRSAQLSDASMSQMANGPYTSGPCYCVEWTQGTAFVCGPTPDSCP